MSKVLNLGCGDDQHEDAHNVDAVPKCDPDEVYDITDYPWPWSGVDTIRMYHVLEHLPDIERALREVERVLKDGGTATVKLPVGVDALADPDHTWGKRGMPWTWRTPKFYCGQRHWDVDVGLSVVNRQVELWSVAPSKFQKGINELIWTWKMNHYGPGEWCFSVPQSCGEFTVVFEK